MIERTLENRSKNIGLKVNAKIEVLPMVPIHQVNTDVTGSFGVECCLVFKLLTIECLHAVYHQFSQRSPAKFNYIMTDTCVAIKGVCV